MDLYADKESAPKTKEKSQDQNIQKKEEEAEPKAQIESWHQNIRAGFIIPPIIQYIYQHEFTSHAL
jgi:hypothetical protein